MSNTSQTKSMEQIVETKALLHIPYVSSHICIENHLFRQRKRKYLKRSKALAFYYYCESEKSGCRAKISFHYIYETDEIFEITRSLQHIETCSAISYSDAHQLLMLSTELKEEAISEFIKNPFKERTTHIIAGIIRKLNDFHSHNPRSIIPLVTSNSIRNWFREAYPLPPSKMVGSRIPDDIRRVNEEECFFLEMSNQNINLVFFTTPQMMNIGRGVSVLELDGTFHSAPKGFHQVLNAVGFVPAFNTFVPIVHVLMTKCTKEAYQMVLNQIFIHIQFPTLKKSFLITKWR